MQETVRFILILFSVAWPGCLERHPGLVRPYPSLFWHEKTALSGGFFIGSDGSSHQVAPEWETEHGKKGGHDHALGGKGGIAAVAGGENGGGGAGGIINSRIERVHYAAREEKSGCCASVLNLFEERFNHHPRLYRGPLEQECEEQLQNFFQSLR